MFSPLLEGIIARENLPVVTADTLDVFAKGNGDTIIFAVGDWKRHVEVNDVAVVLPELIKASNGVLKAAVLERDSERKVQTRFRFSKYPSLIFLRDGAYLGVIPQVLDWSDYIVEINKILAGSPVPPPQYKFPEGCAPAPTKAN